MAARSIASGTISFGLVSIPVRVYVATHSEQIGFNMLHAECGTRIRQQLYCPKHERVVERSEIEKGYQFEKDRYVTFTDEELRALEAEANRAIDIHEFVPLEEIDPVYYEDAHYLGPDKGAEKAYYLLSSSMRGTGKAALAKFTHHGKEHLVLIRPYEDGLVMHSMHYADEVRAFTEVPHGNDQKVRANEVELARKLIDQLSNEKFKPQEYKDDYRERVEAAVKKKIEGEEVTSVEAPPARAQVIDLMDALKQSLASRGGRGAAAAGGGRAARRRPVAVARRREAETPRRRVQKK